MAVAASATSALTAAELEDSMKDILPTGEANQGNAIELSDSSFDDITNLLFQAGHEEWGRRPRTYAVLRMINAVQLMDEFVNGDCWDIALPYAFNSLPHKLSPAQRTGFLGKQALVSTKAIQLEGGPHAIFGKKRLF